MNGRVYDPTLGRFLSPDPIVQFPTFSQSWNRHSYVSNTPTSFTDPTGFTMEEIVVTAKRWSTRDRDLTPPHISVQPIIFHFTTLFAGRGESKSRSLDQRGNGTSEGSSNQPKIGGIINAVLDFVFGTAQASETSDSPPPDDGLTSNEARTVFRNVFPSGFRGHSDINDALPSGELPGAYLVLAEQILVSVAQSELAIDSIGNTAFSGIRGLAQNSLKVFVKQTITKIFKEAIGNRRKREKILEKFLDGVGSAARNGTAKSARPVLDELLLGL